LAAVDSEEAGPGFTEAVEDLAAMVVTVAPIEASEELAL
jgi:hypothetical protein